MAFDFYKLLPDMVRWFDHSASVDTAGETNVSKILYSWEQEYEATKADIAGLTEIIDVDACAPNYLFYLSSLLGTMTGVEGSEIDFKRWFVKNLTYFYKKRGTHLACDKQFQWVLGRLYKLHELWKTIPHEHGDYFRSPDYYANIKSARFDIYYEEDGERQYLTPSQARPIAEKIQQQLPIHVILRHNYKLVNISDSMLEISEDIVDSVVEFNFVDVLSPLYETLVEVTETCQASCEISCQSVWELSTCTNSCQAWCETGCETACEYSCEQACQKACQVVCQVTSCQFGNCELTSCQFACEADYCQADSCQAGGCEEPPCALSCQVMEESKIAGGQLACVSCSEIELFPAQISCIGDDEQSKYYGDIKGFVHWPQHNYPPLNEDWRVTLGVEWPACDMGCEAGCETDCEGDMMCLPAEDIEYSLSGQTERFMNFAAKMHTPQLEVGDWVLVKCVKGIPVTETVTEDANGLDTIFCGTLKYQPHPGTVRVMAEGIPQVTGRAILRAGNCDLYNPKVDHTAAGLQPGDAVQIWNVRGSIVPSGFYDIASVGTDSLDLTTCLCACEISCETDCEAGSCENSCEMGCETGVEPSAAFFSYRAGVITNAYNQIAQNKIDIPGGLGGPCETVCECGCETSGCEAFCETGDEASCVSSCEDGSQFPDAPWTGSFEGDVESGAVNFRHPYVFEVELQSAPMKGSDVIVEYVREIDCTYLLDQVIDLTAGLVKKARVIDVDYGGCYSACETGCEAACQGICEAAYVEGLVRCMLLDDAGDPTGAYVLVTMDRRPTDAKMRNCFPILSADDEIAIYYDNELNWSCPAIFQGVLVPPPV